MSELLRWWRSGPIEHVLSTLYKTEKNARNGKSLEMCLQLEYHCTAQGRVVGGSLCECNWKGHVVPGSA